MARRNGGVHEPKHRHARTHIPIPDLPARSNSPWLQYRSGPITVHISSGLRHAISSTGLCALGHNVICRRHVSWNRRRSFSVDQRWEELGCFWRDALLQRMATECRDREALL